MDSEGEKEGENRENKSAALYESSEHFIFNTLNALQYYILINDSERAMAHLGHFSKLLRGMMYVADKVKLHEELELLDHYLALEGIRFESFEYKIDTVANISLFGTEVPSRIMQPFAERVLSYNNTAMTNSLHVKVRDTAFYVCVDFECGPEKRSNTLMLPKLGVTVQVKNKIDRIGLALGETM